MVEVEGSGCLFALRAASSVATMASSILRILGPYLTYEKEADR
jgi:hypothetical protein